LQTDSELSRFYRIFFYFSNNSWYLAFGKFNRLHPEVGKRIGEEIQGKSFSFSPLLYTMLDYPKLGYQLSILSFTEN